MSIHSNVQGQIDALVKERNMYIKLLKDLAADVQYLTACRCDESYTKRKRHAPNTHCDYCDDILQILKDRGVIK